MDGSKPLLYGPSVAQAAAANEATAVTGSAALRAATLARIWLPSMSRRRLGPIVCVCSSGGLVSVVASVLRVREVADPKCR